MSKKLFICNTPYQLLIAIHMAENMFAKDAVDVIISNHFLGSKDIVKRINEEKVVFRHAYYVESFIFSRRQGKYKGSRIRNRVLYGINIKKELSNFIELIDVYDEFYVANFECFTELIYNYIRRYMNPKVKVFSYEDGYGSLCDDWMFHVAEVEKSSIRKWFDRKILNLWYTPESYAGYYISRPDYLMIKIPCSVIKIDSFEKNNVGFLKKINFIFGYEYGKVGNYSNKVIYFEESTQVEGIDFNGDVEVINKIAGFVGKENIIVKQHPRNTKNRFKELGYLTDSNVGVPWEVILLNQDISNSVLIAIGSSTIIMSDMFSNINGKSIYLEKFMDNSLLKSCHKDFHDKNYGDGDKIYMPKSEEEFIDIVKKLL